MNKSVTKKSDLYQKYDIEILYISANIFYITIELIKSKTFRNLFYSHHRNNRRSPHQFLFSRFIVNIAYFHNTRSAVKYKLLHPSIINPLFFSNLYTTNSLSSMLYSNSTEFEYSFSIRCIEKKKKRYKAIPWQIVTRKVTENGLGAINTGRGSERGWCSGVELRTRASCVTDVQQVAFLGSYPLAPSLPSPSLQANPGHIKSFLNVLTLAVWLLFDRYRPHFDVAPPFSLPFSSLVALSPLFDRAGTMDPRSARIDGLYAKYFFPHRISISFFTGDPLFFFSFDFGS